MILLLSNVNWSNYIGEYTSGTNNWRSSFSQANSNELQQDPILLLLGKRLVHWHSLLSPRLQGIHTSCKSLSITSNLSSNSNLISFLYRRPNNFLGMLNDMAKNTIKYRFSNLDIRLFSLDFRFYCSIQNIYYYIN